jgi:hypothetical protein
MRNKTLVILLASALSGALSGYVLLGIDQLGLLLGPGVVFGVTTTALFTWLYRNHPLKSLLWFGGSVLSWYVAIRIALPPPDFSQSDTGYTSAGYLPAGVIGALILTISFWIFVKRISPLRAGVVVGLGGVLALAMQAIMQIETSQSLPFPLMISFAVWQVGVALALTTEINKR